MSGKRGKAKVHISKPEPPPFLQRMREQIVANEDVERKEQSEKRRKSRPNQGLDDGDDDYTVVKLDEDGLTEEEVREYKKIKKAMETQYKIDSASTEKKKEELDIDSLIDSRVNDVRPKTKEGISGSKSSNDKIAQSSSNKVTTTKKLSYESSSDED